MLTVRRIWVVLVAGWVCAWIARALFDWILGLDETVVVVLSLGAFVLGGAAALGEAREVEQWTPKESRDAYLGWTAFLGFVAAIICLLAVPMPWALLAAAAVAAVSVAVLRRAPPIPADGTRERERV